jgi:hypothetical protein
MRRSWSWALCLGLAITGCSGPSNQPPTQETLDETALSDVGEMYRLHTLEKKKPPTSMADFRRLEMVAPTGLRAITSGDVIVRFGATLPSTEEGPPSGSSDEVLAYQKSVPTSGGQVLMLNRQVKTMTPDEFKAAKLAGTSSSAPAGAAEKAKK